MYLRFGTYTHSANDAGVTINRENLRNDAMRIYRVRERWSINGKVHGDTQAELKTAIDNLKEAYRVDGRGNLELLHNDGSTVSSHALLDARSFGGVRVISGPDFPAYQGAEYATYRSYQMVLEAEYPVEDESLISFTETLTFTGGGPSVGHLELQTGLPQKQILRANTVFRCIQRGAARGNMAYPAIPNPIFPGDLLRSPEISKSDPQRVGNGYSSYPVSWMYEFESALALVGIPNRWIG